MYGRDRADVVILCSEVKQEICSKKSRAYCNMYAHVPGLSSLSHFDAIFVNNGMVPNPAHLACPSPSRRLNVSNS